ncbi:hypothetical protein Sa4125_10330 [Aureimonas sp. SA4125]|nr:hypothetical protein Sa4125_10330 [Aureimonas sp. SA4125]
MPGLGSQIRFAPDCGALRLSQTQAGGDAKSAVALFAAFNPCRDVGRHGKMISAPILQRRASSGMFGRIGQYCCHIYLRGDGAVAGSVCRTPKGERTYRSESRHARNAGDTV